MAMLMTAPTPRLLVILMLALFAAGADLASADAIRKCPAGADGPLIAVDGSILGTRADLQRAREESGAAPSDSVTSATVLLDGRVIESRDIFRIEIVCMNPRDSSFTAGTGVGVISIWTKQGPAPQLEPTVEAIVGAQEAYLERHGAYATTLGALDLPPVDANIELSLSTQPDGWSVTSGVRRYGPQCFAFAGEIEPPYHGVSPGQTFCASVARQSYTP